MAQIVGNKSIIGRPIPWKLAVPTGARSHLREIALIVGLCLLYASISSLLRDGQQTTAVANAERLIALERSLGIFWEPSWNQWAAGLPGWITQTFNWVYILTFLLVVPALALAFYVSDRSTYFRYRNVIILSFLFALVIHTTIPVAPPRVMTEFGFLDTMRFFGPGWYDSRDAMAFFNANAALPSLHFAWSITFGVLLFTLNSKPLKALGIAYPAITFAAIIATGNHYFLDAAAGAAIVILAYAAFAGVRRIESPVKRWLSQPWLRGGRVDIPAEGRQ